MEPDYIAQTAARLSPRERMQWFSDRADEARERGCGWLRFSVDDAGEPTRALVEGWNAQPDEEGEPRWQLVEAGDGD